MGSRKQNRAEAIKEAKKVEYFAKLRNCPTSPRKMRLVADMIRGLEVEKALYFTQHSGKEAAGRVHKLILSAVDNWQKKNEDSRVEEAALYIKTIYVDSGRMLKRLQTAPQGRAHRIRKRSNHVTLVIGDRAQEVAADTAVEEVNKVEN